MRPTPRDPSAPPSARPAPDRAPTTARYPAPNAPAQADRDQASGAMDARANPHGYSQAKATPRPPAPWGNSAANDNEAASDDRIRRYEQALTDPMVQDLLKRFEADIISREVGDEQTWQDKLKRS